MICLKVYWICGLYFQAEGGRSSISSDSDSDDNSQGSLASSHAFLDQCISSALPKKTSTLPRPSSKPSGAAGTKEDEAKSASSSSVSHNLRVILMKLKSNHFKTCFCHCGTSPILCKNVKQIALLILPIVNKDVTDMSMLISFLWI